MKTGRFLVLLTVAVVLCVGAIIVYRQQNAQTASESWRGKKLFADLSGKVEDIGRIEFTRADNKLDLVRGEENEWRIVSNEGYLADNNRVNRLLFDLTDLSAADRITNDKTKYAKFGVEKEVGEEGGLKISDKKGKPLAVVSLGKRREVPFDPDLPMRAGGNYLRVGSDPYVYLTNQTELWSLEPKARGWADTAIMSVPSEDLTDIVLATATSGTAHLVWNDGALKPEIVPRGMQEKTSAINDIRSGLSVLRFDEVFGAKTDRAKGIDFYSTLTATAKDGTVYCVRGGKRDTKRYIALGASCGQPFYTDDDKASTITLAAAKKKASEAQAAVPEFNKKHGPWVYEIEGWSYARFIRNPGDFIEPKPKPSSTPTPIPVSASTSEVKKEGKKPAAKPSTATPRAAKSAKPPKAAKSDK